ncbi:polycomb group protein EMBRYONIC FLOWER 2 [Citrus sinensis]|uniref:Polycomb group protein EMBRYONIC FLOWER 2 n=1 Tax=Citrus sinensis TaxID=2711 RepID=A0ACB8HV53_CITSI|nr:polycomb group protein EMBRYONIC FLOWER 2 [Citrus sinensis]
MLFPFPATSPAKVGTDWKIVRCRSSPCQSCRRKAFGKLPIEAVKSRGTAASIRRDFSALGARSGAITTRERSPPPPLDSARPEVSNSSFPSPSVEIRSLLVGMGISAPRSRSATTTPVRSRSVTTTLVRSRTVTNDLPGYDSGLGAVIRDLNNKVIVVAVKSTQFTGDVKTVEAEAIEWGLVVVFELALLRSYDEFELRCYLGRMPGIPLVARETSSYSRSTDQMCREDARVHLSAEEEIAAEESLSIYCKPVELYNILQRRAIRNPSFLQRCLSYQIHEKHNRRIQMTISLSETVNEGLQARFPFPLYILLGRLVSGTTVSELCPIFEMKYSAVYRFSRACILTNFTGVEGSTQVQANFVLPEISRLQLKAKSCTLAILLVNFAGSPNSSSGTDLTKARLGTTLTPCEIYFHCQLRSCLGLRSWEKSPNLSLGQRAELTYPVDMHSGFLKLSCLDKDKCVSIQMPFNSGSSVHVTISAEEIGGRDKSPYNSFTCSDISSPSLSRIIRLRAGNVVFNYRYYNNKLQRTEVTEDFSCPFCLAKCASFKGLRYHLSSSHDLFNFEFWVTEEYQAVNVSVKTDIWRSEVVADGVDPKQQTFFFCSKQRRHRRLKSLLQQSKHVHPLVLKPPGVCELLDKADETSRVTRFSHDQLVEMKQSGKDQFVRACVGGNDYRNSIIAVAESAQHVPSSFNVAGASNADAQLYTDPEYQLLSGNNLAAPAMLQFAKTRKLSIERSDSRNRTLLQKRQFFHSHRAQPMAWEQVVSDRDSEDEVDDDVADLEDRRVLEIVHDQAMESWSS